MRKAGVGFAILWGCVLALAQRPSDPALLIPQNAPELDYVAVAQPFTFPAGTALAGAAASVAFDSKGHLFVLTRAFDRSAKVSLRDHTAYVSRRMARSGQPMSVRTPS